MKEKAMSVIHFASKNLFLLTSWHLAPCDFCKHKEKDGEHKKYINTKHIKYLYTAMSKTPYIRIMQSFN